MAVKPEKRTPADYLNDLADVVTGKKAPTFEFSFDDSTILKVVGGFFAALLLALLLNQLIAFFFRKIE